MAVKSHLLTEPNEYPQLLPTHAIREALAFLRSSEALAHANGAIAMKKAELRGSVLTLIGELEGAEKSRSWKQTFRAAHEIRGLAATAGLAATGRIANGLCQYLDAVHVARGQADATVVLLHVEAIARSAHTEDEAARHGDKVASELAALVARKLSDVKSSETHV
jgi:chemotaxis protein histidine kinase CheA